MYVCVCFKRNLVKVLCASMFTSVSVKTGAGIRNLENILVEILKKGC